MWSFDEPLPRNLSQFGQLRVTYPDGKTGLLKDTLQPGVPTVISLWASWCGPCFREAPKIARLRRKFGRGRANIVYLNVRDPYATRGDLADHMAQYAMDREGYLIAADEGRLGKLTNDRGNLIPRTIVFDRAGEPLATIVGYKPVALARVEGLIEE
jgi:cytochrome c biogenesis protein CcmG/thiol:disulfide interchange protein DsbE